MPQIVSRRFAAGDDRLEKTRAVRLHDEGNQMYVIIDFHKIDELPGISVFSASEGGRRMCSWWVSVDGIANRIVANKTVG